MLVFLDSYFQLFIVFFRHFRYEFFGGYSLHLQLFLHVAEGFEKELVWLSGNGSVSRIDMYLTLLYCRQ